MARRTSQIHQAAFRQQDDVLSVEVVQVDLRLDGILGCALVIVQPRYVNLIVEVTDVANDGLVLHLLKVLSTNDVFVACGCNNDVTFLHGIHHAFHFIPIHSRLQGANRINFSHHDTATRTAK